MGTMRPRLLLVAAWAVVTVAATVAAWQAVRVVASSVTGEAAAPVGAEDLGMEHGIEQEQRVGRLRRDSRDPRDVDVRPAGTVEL